MSISLHVKIEVFSPLFTRKNELFLNELHFLYHYWYLVRLEQWTCGSPTKLNKANAKVLHVGQGNPKHKPNLGRE